MKLRLYDEENNPVVFTTDKLDDAKIIQKEINDNYNIKATIE